MIPLIYIYIQFFVFFTHSLIAFLDPKSNAFQIQSIVCDDTESHKILHANIERYLWSSMYREVKKTTSKNVNFILGIWFYMLSIAYASNTKMINKVTTMQKKLCVLNRRETVQQYKLNRKRREKKKKKQNQNKTKQK